jgi:hypothetical protein
MALEGAGEDVPPALMGAASYVGATGERRTARSLRPAIRRLQPHSAKRPAERPPLTGTKPPAL